MTNRAGIILRWIGILVVIILAAILRAQLLHASSQPSSYPVSHTVAYSDTESITFYYSKNGTLMSYEITPLDQMWIRLQDETAQGQSAPAPPNGLKIRKVYSDGVELVSGMWIGDPEVFAKLNNSQTQAREQELIAELKNSSATQ